MSSYPSTEQLAEALGVHRITLADLVRRGLIPSARRAGRRAIVWDSAAVEEARRALTPAGVCPARTSNPATA